MTDFVGAGSAIGDMADTRDTSDTTQSGLIVSGLCQSYRKHPVLKDVNFCVRRGEVVGLLGPNGAGKSTCFYFAIGLLQKAGAGQVLLDGVDISRYPMYKRARLGIGYLPQEASVFRSMNVEQNIMAVLEICESDKQVRRDMLEQLLEQFAITKLRDAIAYSLSGGERRRLEMARLLAARPEFVLQDEPLAGVDPIAVKQIRELILSLKQRNIGILLSDHNVHETLKIVDRAYILYDGKVIIEGTPAEIIASPEARQLYLGDDFNLHG